MHEDQRTDAGLSREGHTRPAQEAPARPLTDREVPLGPQADRPLAAPIQAWLDGELPEAAVRKRESSKDVEFWRGLDAEMARVRRLRTPQHVEAQIMAALPAHAPAATISPWYRREFVITPATALLVGIALVVAGSIVTALLVR